MFGCFYSIFSILEGQKIIPTGAKAIAIGWNKVLVKWTPLANRDVAYIIFLKTDHGKELSRETKHSQMMFDDLEPLTTYSVFVQAKFGWGLGPKVFSKIVAKTKGMLVNLLFLLVLLFCIIIYHTIL